MAYYHQNHRSQMSVPVRVEVGGLRQPTNTTVPISHERGYHTLGGSSTGSSGWFDKSHDDDLFSRFDDPPMLGIRRADSDRWFDDMRRRFDERRRQWDAEMRQMRSSFFTTPAFHPRVEERILTAAPISPPQPISPPVPADCPVSTSYERGEDGSLHFLARFDVQAFNQDEVNVTVREGQIVVTASREQRMGGSSTTKQLIRTVDLPKGANETKIAASLSTDRILLVDVPIRPAIQSPAFTSMSGSSGTSDLATPSTLSGTGRSSHISSRSSPAPTYSIVAAKPLFHVEIPVGGDYQPNEIQIRTLNNRVYISARHEERLSNRNTFREFSKEYDIPEHIDPKSINARLEHGILHLEGTALP